MLSPFRRFRTHDPDQAQEQTAQLLSPHKLGVASLNAMFDAQVSLADFGSTSLYHMRYGSEVTIDRAPQSNYMTVLIPLNGTIFTRHQGQEFTAVPETTQVVLSEGDSVHMRWSADCTVISLRADIESLRSTLGDLMRTDDVGLLRFNPRVDSEAARTAMLGAVHLLTSSLRQSEDGVPPGATRALQEHALSTVLLALAHNHSDAIYNPGRHISNRAVRQAVDIMNSDDAPYLTVVDVARRIGIGVRALEIGFKKHVGTSPRQYLQKVRLHRAHAQLLVDATDGNLTVGRIAMNWGFTHAGRFSKAYRIEFGEAPSETLHRSA